MSEWTARRFWQHSAVVAGEGGCGIELDGRAVMTPGKKRLVVPTVALANAIAAEWDAQQDVIVPQTMPLTRAANSAIEKVTPQIDAVANMLAAYAGTDLLCYRARLPLDLAQRQHEAWQPWLDWAARELGAKLTVTQGVMPVDQAPGTLASLRARLTPLTAFELTALHDMVTLPGSLILGLAMFSGQLKAATAHDLARLDEVYQSQIWGTDPEAEALAADRLNALQTAQRLRQLLK